MTLSDFEIREIKEKLLSQVNNLPPEKRKEVENQIKNMSSKDFEKFLEKNESISKCPFCSILEGEVESVKIYEDELSSYILDINPLSYGHTLVIPKDHGIQDVERYKEGIEYISEIFKQIFVPKEIKILSKSPFGHTIFEIVPDYGDQLIKKTVELKELKRIKDTFEKFLQKPEEKSQEDFEDNLNSKEEPKMKTFNEEVKDEFPKFHSRIP